VEPQHHHSAVNNAILRELIREGVQGGLIEPTPEGEPLVACQNHCFPNTGGKTRPCITGRLLNRWTVREPVHNTSVDEVRQRLPANARFFSQVDVRWAFMLLSIEPASRKYTTFYGPDGRHYRYKRMTFGFVNAPATWARYIQHVLRDLTKICVIYVDDILIWGETAEENLRNVNRVLKALEAANIPIRTAKLHLLRERIDFLGGIVSSGGVFEPNQDSVDAIVKCATPRNAGELRSFLGVVEWVIKHLGTDAAKFMRPLYNKTIKGTRWSWTPEDDAALAQIKTRAINYFRLNALNMDSTEELTVKLRSDASDWGIGAALFQGDRLISIYSYAFNTTEQRWSTINQEAYGIVRVLAKWRHMLLGLRFTVETDHQPLIWLIKATQDNKGSQMNERWLTALSTYDIDWRHLPGSRNVEADALSRAPFITPTVDARQNKASLMYAAAVNTTTAIGNPTVLFLTTDDATDSNEFYQAALRVANGEDQRTWGADDRHALQLPHLHPIASRLFIRNNRLLLRATVTEDDLIVVPAHAVEELLLDFHQHHNGIPALLQALQQRYYWPTLRADVESHVRNCLNCNKGKRGPDAQQQLHPLPII
jgi:hypothetical protein